ncbi:MAG TPA: META domain-containing protein [Gemmatimonadaceae bacterium]
MRRSGFCLTLIAAAALGVGACARTGQSGDDTPAASGAATTASSDTASSAATDLPGTTWQLVRFEGGDGTVLTPDDRAKYTLTFQPDGRLSARIDCNRGMGSWTSTGPSHLEFGPLALTRAMCPPESLHDQIVRQWPYVRSYVMRDGHLFLSLMADGGIYEFEPVK